MSESASGLSNTTPPDSALPGPAIDNISHSRNSSSSNNSNSNNHYNSSLDSSHTHMHNNSTSSNVFREPKTPLLNKNSSTFESPAPISVLPETPDRIPRQITTELESTPLLSPAPPSNIFAAPGRRRGSIQSNAPDFYTLLKSPDVRMDDKNLKRSSLDLFGNPDSNSSPERINKEYDTDHLLKSPRRDVNEIRKISENLRTRLNYANFKVQHGLSRKSIGELEQSLDSIANSSSISKPENRNLDDFWNLRADNLPATSNSTYPDNNTLLASPGQFAKNSLPKRRTSFNTAVSLDDIAKRGVKASPDVGSSEFSSNKVPMTLQGSQSSQNSHGIHSSPLRIPSGGSNITNLSVSTANKGTSDTKLEQDAIFSLISMASPTKYTAGSSISPSPPKFLTSPTKGSVKLPPPNIASLNSAASNKLPPLSAPGALGENTRNGGMMNDYVFPPPALSKVAPASQGLGMFTSTGKGAPQSSHATKIDDDLTEDEATEDEDLDDEVITTDKVDLNSLAAIRNTVGANTNTNNKFRTTRYDDLKNKMTSQKDTVSR